MTHLYHPGVYDRSQSAGSYWETTIASPASYPSLNHSKTCDVAIIGAGITGLSAAFHLCEQGLQVAVLDAGYPGWGASGRNGGFCCVGATKLSDAELLRRFGRAETERFYQEQRQAVELVRDWAIAEQVDIDVQGDGELEVTHYPSRHAELVAQCEFLQQVARYPCRLMSRQELADYSFQNAEATSALWMGVGFGLNPLKYSLGLANAVHRRGGHLYAYSPVQRWETMGNQHLLHTPGGTLTAPRVLVATNGYTEDDLHPVLSGRLLPILSNVMVTRPLTVSERVAQGWTTDTPVYDTRNLLFYYRLLKDGRCLFGSRGGTWGGTWEGDRHYRWMKQRFQALFPAWRHVEITHRWNGLVCASASLTPHVGTLSSDPTVFYSLAYHGNGVAAATWSGRCVAQLISGQMRETDLCAVLRQPLKPFPFPQARIWSLRAAYLGYSLQDALP